MIILEGPDGAGKTTLAERLVSDGVVAGAMLSPRRSKEANISLWDATRNYQFTYGENSRVLVDRYFFSEIVYGTVLRHKIEFGAYECLTMFKYIANNCFTIFCLPAVEELVFDKPQGEGVINRIKDIHTLYYGLWRSLSYWSPEKVALYNWRMPRSYELLTDNIRRFQGGQCK